MDDRSRANQELIAENAALKQRLLDLERSAAEGTRAQGRDTPAILHTVGAPIFVKDNNHRFVLANRACCELFGMEEADAIGKTLAEHIPEHEMQHFFAVDRGVLDTGIPNVSEETLTISNVTRAIVTKKTRFIDESGHRFLVGAIHEITARKQAEQELARTNELLERTGALARVGGWQVNLETMKLSWTRETFRIAGRTSPVEPPLAEGIELFAPEARPAITAAVQAAIDSGTSYDLELPLITEQGERRWVRTQGFAETQDGKVVRIFGTFQDITERKEAAERLRASDQRFNDLVNSTDGIVWEADATTLGFTSVSLNAERLLGYPVADWLQPGFWAAHIHPADRDQTVKYCVACTARAESHDFEYRFTAADGRVVWLRDIVRVVTENNQPRWLRGLMVDITGRKTVEQRLTQFQYTLDQTLECVFLFRPGDFRFVYVNAGAVRQLGFTAAELLGMSPLDIKPMFTREGFRQLVQPLMAGVQPSLLFETVHRHKDGHDIPVEVSLQLVNPGGPDACFVAIALDITARRQADAESDALKSELQQAHKLESIGRLAGGVAHDFNNMLQVIAGHTDLALGQVGEHPARASLLKVQKAAAHSANLTNQLLAFARQQPVDAEVLDLNDTVAVALSMLRRLIGENVTLQWTPGDGLWPVKMDPTQVEQILTNLCINARDAVLDVGRLTLETHNIHLETPTAAGDHVQLVVSDNGAGMSSEVLAHLFEPFFTTKALGQGTGLGLSTVYGIVQQNGGHVTVSSELGHGTTFRISLPRYVGVSDHTVAPLATAEAPAGGGETVLLVEDEPDVLELVTSMLEHLGYAVLAAGTPSEALRLAREHVGRIHLILSDMVMPDMNGQELMAQIVAFRPEITRVFMSGYADAVMKGEQRLDDEASFLAKPFTAHQLASALRTPATDLPGFFGPIVTWCLAIPQTGSAARR